MLYNFFVGQTASLLGQLLGRSLADLEPRSYPLTEIEEKECGGLYFGKDNDGNLFHVGFYITHYNNIMWGKSPSLHIDFCDNVIKLKGKMRATNSPYVTYYSRDNRIVYQNQRLNICKKCLSLFRNKTSVLLTGRSFDDFILSIEEDETLKCTTSGQDGYSANWKQISRSLRESRNYTCETCGYKLTDPRLSKFIQTHHINSFQKLNNRKDNLKCLCVKCHSEVDEYHKQQFSSIENKILLAEFEEYKFKTGKG
jgi:hypothetical protein